MSGDKSVTFWIGRLKQGDARAVEELWRSHYDRLVRLARRKLGGTPLRAADEEDVALSALHSFCAGIEKEKFPQLENRDDLWRLLVVITCRKASRRKQSDRRQKRGGGKVRGESIFIGAGGQSDDLGIGAIEGDGPGPASAAALAEEFQRLLSSLGDDLLRELALLKLQGFSNEEIAERLKCGLRTVERRLRGIRTLWSEDASG